MTGDTAGPDPWSSAALREDGPRQRRWLSLPGSRLVVNPFAFTTTRTPAEYSAGPQVPLNLGYYVGSRALDRTGILGCYRRGDHPGSVDIGWQDEFATLDPEWTAGPGLQATVEAGRLRLELATGTADYWGELRRTVQVDPGRTRYLSLSVAEVADAWGLRLRVPGRAEIVLAPDTTRPGSFSYDLLALLEAEQLTPPTAPVAVELVLRVATWERPAVFDHVRLLAVDPALIGASTVRTSWLPDHLPWEAEYADGTRLDGADVFVDPDSVLRAVAVHPGADAGPASWTLAGRYTGEPAWDAAARILTVAGDEVSYGVAVAVEPAGPVAYAATEPELLAGLTTSQPTGDRGYWSLPVHLAAGARRRALAAVTFAPSAGGGTAAAVAGADAARAATPAATIRRQRQFWDGYLAKVPRPANFDLQAVPALGVSAAEIRRTYLAAWVFLAANTIGPMPEAGFDFPQHAAGKPSLYADGPAQAASTASWESLVAMQFAAYLDPAAVLAGVRWPDVAGR